MSTKLFELRNVIKDLSAEQKFLRPQRKEKCDSRKYSQKEAIEIMRSNKKELRHLHIAYSMLRGIPYEMIERKVADGNQPSWSRIDEIIGRYKDEQVIRSRAS